MYISQLSLSGPGSICDQNWYRPDSSTCSCGLIISEWSLGRMEGGVARIAGVRSRSWVGAARKQELSRRKPDWWVRDVGLCVLSLQPNVCVLMGYMVRVKEGSQGTVQWQSHTVLYTVHYTLFNNGILKNNYGRVYPSRQSVFSSEFLEYQSPQLGNTEKNAQSIQVFPVLAYIFHYCPVDDIALCWIRDPPVSVILLKALFW